jgi:hypothetical protein
VAHFVLEKFGKSKKSITFAKHLVRSSDSIKGWNSLFFMLTAKKEYKIKK